MKYVSNCYIDKLEFLPDEFELAVTKSWCISVISMLNKLESYDDLVHTINTCIYSNEYQHNSPGHVSKYVIMSVGTIKRITDICGAETLCYILPYNFEQVSNDFLYSKLGDIKTHIDSLIALDDYDTIFDLINNIADEYLKRLSLIYMKSLYVVQTENKIVNFRNSRRKIVERINSNIKESLYSYY